MPRLTTPSALALALFLCGTALPADPATVPVARDPAAVERFGPAYRYPRAGWIVLHVEGDPYERGYQHGHLLAPEIGSALKEFASVVSSKNPEEGWKQLRTLVNALFLRRYDEEYLLEMKGIADGANAAGTRFDGRPLDLVDIVGVNAWTEVLTLDSATEATPTGIEGIRFKDMVPAPERPSQPARCSAFAATGPATRTGKIVFGHITMFGLQGSHCLNVWLDVKPTKGHRVLMQSFPGGIQSSTDYYLNDAGLLVTETTLNQTRFEIEGMAEASRIRHAVQYCDSIDGAVVALTKDNNGLYTNEWLLGDTKTNEIAMFELGTKKTKLWRSSKSEWFGGTAGFYWGCNNAKDVDVRLETVPSMVGRPASVVFAPGDRDLAWQKLYDAHRGQIDESFGFEAFTTPPIASAFSVDAKFTTSELAADLKSWAVFGPPAGRTWEPTSEDRTSFPGVKPLVSGGWTLLDGDPPALTPARPPVTAVDLACVHSAGTSVVSSLSQASHESTGSAVGPAWHGTILPESGGDTWLATAFADYERIVAREKLDHETWSGSLAEAASDGTNLALYPHRCEYLTAARALPGKSPANVQPAVNSGSWYTLAAGRGVYVLADLRARLGAPFEDLMDRFGREHAGKPASTAQLEKLLEEASREDLARFFDDRIGKPGIPRLSLEDVKAEASGDGWVVRGALSQTEATWEGNVEVALETECGSEVETVSLSEPRFELHAKDRPRRLAVDPRNRLLKANGGAFAIDSFEHDLERTLIVHGTSGERVSLREAAELLQRRIASHWSNIFVPVKSDAEVTEEDLRTHHLLLVGRPAVNTITARMKGALPITFGPASFTVLGETYAHPESAVVVAGTNPEDARYSVVAFVGLDATSTRRVVEAPAKSCEVLLIPAGSSPLSLVLPAKELVVSLGD